jgi:hypothetical protein
VETSVFTVSGTNIFFAESIIDSAPTNKIKNETIIDAMYSILACPNGCPLSAGFAEILKLIKEMTDDPASERLLSASAVIATEAASKPAKILIIANTKFVAIPTMLDIVPYCFLTAGDPKFFRSFTKIRDKSSTI